ncbi:hypothetical protein L1887_08359 [Cichorium endivia]|nr:hypothetical protein L1887_08359 [Cichorium endivia]
MMMGVYCGVVIDYEMMIQIIQQVVFVVVVVVVGRLKDVGVLKFFEGSIFNVNTMDNTWYNNIQHMFLYEMKDESAKSPRHFYFKN